MDILNTLIAACFDDLEYKCFSGECIPNEWICDGKYSGPDCASGEDELFEICGMAFLFTLPQLNSSLLRNC